MKRVALWSKAVILFGVMGFSASLPAQTLVYETVPEQWAYLLQKRSDISSQDQLHAGKRIWNPGDTLKVCFFSGNPVVNSLIANVASEWQKYANLKLDFGAPGVWRDCMNSAAGFSDIRIGFGQRGYFSAVGTDSKVLANVYQPSMNFEVFNLIYDPFQVSPTGALYTPDNVVSQSLKRDRGTILHEFGHALGLLHEHQNPNLGCQNEIKWTGPGNVYEYYGRAPNRWDRQQVDRNLGPIALADPDYQAGVPDRESIMIYAQPAEIFIHGTASPCYVIEKNEISKLDKSLVSKLYPAGVNAPSDTEFSTAANIPAAQLAGPVPTQDRLARIRADLSSDIVSARREARRQLALEIERTSSDALSQLVKSAASSGNYRQQLGLVVALDKAPSTPTLSATQAATVRDDLNAIAKQSGDTTLKAATARAMERLGVK